MYVKLLTNWYLPLNKKELFKETYKNSQINNSLEKKNIVNKHTVLKSE